LDTPPTFSPLSCVAFRLRASVFELNVADDLCLFPAMMAKNQPARPDPLSVSRKREWTRTGRIRIFGPLIFTYHSNFGEFTSSVNSIIEVSVVFGGLFRASRTAIGISGARAPRPWIVGPQRGRCGCDGGGAASPAFGKACDVRLAVLIVLLSFPKSPAACSSVFRLTGCRGIRKLP
jgi:hypothetical protein